jgi:hypothetical protein
MSQNNARPPFGIVHHTDLFTICVNDRVVYRDYAPLGTVEELGSRPRQLTWIIQDAVAALGGDLGDPLILDLNVASSCLYDELAAQSTGRAPAVAAIDEFIEGCRADDFLLLAAYARGDLPAVVDVLLGWLTLWGADADGLAALGGA